MLQRLPQIRARFSYNAMDIRHLFADSFTSPAGTLSWQHKNI